VDAGPDAFLARVPWAAALARRVGLGDELVSPAPGGARLWSRGALRPLPEGLLMGVPTDVLKVARSGVLRPAGLARAALEPFLPRRAGRSGDASVGRLVRGRFGNEVLERLVDPLLGGVYAGDADAMDLHATVPQLAVVADRSRSLLTGARASTEATRAGAGAAAPGPVFLAPRRGMGSLVDAVLAVLAADTGVTMHLDATVQGLTPSGAGWAVHGDVFDTLQADAVIVAVPAHRAASLVEPVAPDPAALLAGIPLGSVVMTTLAVPEAALGRPLDGSGYLVPKPEQRTVTACSWGSSKWPQWKMPGLAVLRVSAGRYGDDRPAAMDDDTLLDHVLEDLRRHIGLQGEPTAVRITRWDDAFPQYLPGHRARVAAIRAGLRRAAPGVLVAGAALDGIGIPACIRQGQEAAAALAASAA
jgi:protoporphyrinogen/coproporphyrinogen III oxidase